MEHRAKIAEKSREMWAVKREAIIAAQNLGKGEAFREKQAEAQLRLWSDPDYSTKVLLGRAIARNEKRKKPA